MRSIIWALILCMIAASAAPDTASRDYAEKHLLGHWVGDGDNSDNPYKFQVLHCANGRFGLAIKRQDESFTLYFGSWQTDGETVVQMSEISSTVEPHTFEVSTTISDVFSNIYHIVELTDDRFVYEWRDETTRRFEAEKLRGISDDLSDKLHRLACEGGYLFL